MILNFLISTIKTNSAYRNLVNMAVCVFYMYKLIAQWTSDFNISMYGLIGDIFCHKRSYQRGCDMMEFVLIWASSFFKLILNAPLYGSLPLVGYRWIIIQFCKTKKRVRRRVSYHIKIVPRRANYGNCLGSQNFGIQDILRPSGHPSACDYEMYRCVPLFLNSKSWFSVFPALWKFYHSDHRILNNFQLVYHINRTFCLFQILICWHKVMQNMHRNSGQI